jgi:FtsH-binding integral membrane protein
MPNVATKEGSVTTQRSALWEATHTGLFASVYWAVWGIAIGLAIAAFAWGTPQIQQVVGYLVIAVVIAQIVASTVRARHIERRRAADGEPRSDAG